jgi:hypothetical protein
VSSSKRFLAGGQPKGLRLAWRTCGPWARYSGLRANEAAPQSSFAWYKPANEATKLLRLDRPANEKALCAIAICRA